MQNIAMLAVFLAATQAQDSVPPDSVFRLRPLDVVGSILPAATGPRIRAMPSSNVTIVDRAEQRAYSPRLLNEVVAQRGLAAWYDDLGSPFRRTIVMRGFAASPVVGLPQGVTVFVDGVPMNEPAPAR